MTVVRWDPWGEIATLQRAFGWQGRTPTPPIDVFKTEDGLRVRIELPGMRPEDVEVSVADGRLTVSGERATDETIEEDRWVRRERSYGRFERTFALPRGTDADKIGATFEHGVLELTIPEAPERQPRKIEIAA